MVDFSATTLVRLVRLMLFAGSLQFICLTVAAALYYLGYYYRGWPEKVSSVIARAFLVATPIPPLTIPQADPVLGPLLVSNWAWIAAFFLLVGLTSAVNVYAYWKLYMPRLREHPAYRGKDYYERRW